METARHKAAFEYTALSKKLPQRVFRHSWIESKSLRGGAQCKGPMRARVPAHQLERRMFNALK
jgi:hypothetical protein